MKVVRSFVHTSRLYLPGDIPGTHFMLKSIYHFKSQVLTSSGRHCVWTSAI